MHPVGPSADSLLDVALLAYGGPGSPAEVPAFLETMTGRPARPETLDFVNARYAAIGGGSPLPAMTARQAVALEARLAQRLAFPLRVRPGFLYSEPSVATCLHGLDSRDRVAVPLSPFASRLTSGKYRTALDAAGGQDVPLLEGWHDDPGFVHVISRRVHEALDGENVDEWAVLFTAHNVPRETILGGDPYLEQLHMTISQLIPAIMPGDWRFALQSKGRGGGEWLEPEADDAVRGIAEEGWKKLLVVPVGFVSDNVETFYDLDVELRELAEGLGLDYRRSACPNDAPGFIEVLADVVVDYLARRPRDESPHFSGGPGPGHL